MAVRRFDFVFVIIMVYMQTGNVSGQSYENVTNLRTALLSSYAKDVRPVFNQSDVLNVNITIVMSKIPSVDSVRGTIEVVFQMILTWKDEHLTWIPSDYGGVNHTTFSVGDVFVPSVRLGYSTYSGSLYDDGMTVKYRYDGSAFFDPLVIGTVFCTFYMKYWPFDKQICYISVYAYGYDNTELTLTDEYPAVRTNIFGQTGEWWVDVDSFESKIDNSYYLTQIHYKFKMNRMSTYYVLNMALPISGLGFVSGMAFLLPSDADTRVSFSLTILLSLAVYLGVVSDDVPRGSDPVPLFSVFLVYAITFMSILTIVLILNAKIFVRSSDVHMSKMFKLCVRIAKFRCNKVETLSNNQRDKALSVYDSEDMVEFKTKRVKEVKAGLDETFSKDDGNDQQPSWEEVSMALDKIILIVTVLVAYIPAAIIIICIAALSDYTDAKNPF